VVEQVAPDRYTLLSGAGAREGNKFARIEVRPGDNPIFPASSGTERAEVYGLKGKNNTTIFETETSGRKQYCFSTKFDESWTPIPIVNGVGFGIVFQIHPPPAITPSNPTFALSATDQFRVAMRVGDFKKNPNIKYNLTDGSLNIGKWIDWKITIKFAIDSTGLVIVQRRNEDQENFVEVFRKVNFPTLQFNSSINGGSPGKSYIKFGLYRNAQPFTSIMYNDAFVENTISQSSDYPSITLDSISNHSMGEIICFSNLTTNGTGEIFDKGVCWSTSKNPTIADSKTSDGSSKGTFIIKIKGLIPNTTYHFRAYAINEVGISYSSDYYFTTQGL
jgi:hypothetical protein